MQIVEDRSLANSVMDYLKSQQQVERAGIHATDVIYCLTKAYWERTQPLTPTESESLLFATGIGLEEVLVGRHDGGLLQLDGIYASPDVQAKDGFPVLEVKTTRISAKKAAEELSPGWFKQMRAYAKIIGTTEFGLVVLHLMGNYSPPFPIIKSYRVSFTQEELDKQWLIIRMRRDLLTGYLTLGKPPAPYRFTEDMDQAKPELWECKNCRYADRCRLLVNGGAI